MSSGNGGILFIDDDGEFAQNLLRLWVRTGVQHCISSQEAVKCMDAARPDLILLDLALPRFMAETDEEEGFRVLSHVRNERYWNVPVVILTRDVTAATRRRALAEGANAILCKPVDVEELERTVSSLSPEPPGPGASHPAQLRPPGASNDGLRPHSVGRSCFSRFCQPVKRISWPWGRETAEQSQED